MDLKRAGHDVAIRGTGELEPGLVARHLGRSSLIAVASPGYVEQHGAPRSLRDLKAHRCLLGFARGELPQTHWTDRKGRRVHVEGHIASNDIFFLGQAALRGLGIVLLPAAMVQPYLDEGRLVQVLEAALGWETRMAIVYAEREFLPPQVRAFVDAVVGWVESDPSVLWPAPTSARGKRRTVPRLPRA